MVEELKVVVTADTRDYILGTKKVHHATKQARDEMGRFTRQSTTGWGKFTASAKVAAAAAAATALIIAKKAVTAAVDFGRAMAEVSTITDLNDQQSKQLTETVKQMSVAMGVDAKESARGLYQTISAGVTDSTEAMELLEVATKLSIAGLTKQEIVVDVLTTVINAYGLRVKDANDISDTLFQTVRLGKIRLEDLAGSLGTVIPIAAVAGISLEELGGAIAALTKGGLSAERSATALRAAFTAILQPSKKMQAAAKTAGFEIGMEALKGKGLTGVLEALTKLEEKDSEATLKLFQNKRALVGMLSLGSDGAREFTDAMEGMEGKLGSANTAFEKMNKSASRQFDIFKAKLNVTMIELGNAILPSVISGMEVLGPAIEDVGKSIADNEDMWTDLATGIGIAATAAAGLLGLLGKLGGGIGAAVGRFVTAEVLHTGPGGVPYAGTPGRLAETQRIRAAAEARGITPGRLGQAVTINMGATYVQTTDPRERLEVGAFSQKVAS